MTLTGIYGISFLVFRLQQEGEAYCLDITGFTVITNWKSGRIGKNIPSALTYSPLQSMQVPLITVGESLTRYT